MKITCDPIKDAANIYKHGISLWSATKLDWKNALLWFDERNDYGEPRQIALAELNRRLYFVVFVDRLEVRRIVSLRKANQRERNSYYAEAT